MKLKIYCYNCYFDNFISSLSKNEKKEELISCCQRWFLFFFVLFFFSHVIWRLKIQMSISYFMSEKIQKKFREFRNFKFGLLTDYKKNYLELINWMFSSENKIENEGFISILCNNCRFSVFSFSMKDLNCLQFEDDKNLLKT